MSNRRRLENPAVGKGPQLFGWLLIILSVWILIQGIFELAGILFVAGTVFILIGMVSHWFWNS